MADFCKQCSILMGFGPEGDFQGAARRAGVTDEDEQNGIGALVLCEGCGPTVVDRDGACMAKDCSNCTSPRVLEVLRDADAWQRRRQGLFGPVYRAWDWWNGTPWEPGQRHYLRWKLLEWRHGPDDCSFFDDPNG